MITKQVLRILSFVILKKKEKEKVYSKSHGVGDNMLAVLSEFEQLDCGVPTDRQSLLWPQCLSAKKISISDDHFSSFRTMKKPHVCQYILSISIQFKMYQPKQQTTTLKPYNNNNNSNNKKVVNIIISFSSPHAPQPPPPPPPTQKQSYSWGVRYEK